MLNIDLKPTFTVPVSAKLPGGFAADFKVTFEAVPSSEAGKFDLGTADGGRDFLERAIADLDEIVDDAGNAVPFAAAKSFLIDQVWARRPLIEAYTSGFNRAAEGN